MARSDSKSSQCPIRYSLELIGGKWKFPLICLLFPRSPKRYSELKRKLGNITNMMLAQSLKELEADGLILRKQYNQIPPRVEYTLTHDGRGLYDALHALAHWGIDHLDAHEAGTPYCYECLGNEVAQVLPDHS
ncbi:MAG: helix-turn-helix transcriptional regulator [Candidatus Adiutrix sp.]|jgi:DNA-binding HxlR family transcriptional regulator|nr:helix-turn-helix transcriptional regulator [Candidatus Adiutrix sp.]